MPLVLNGIRFESLPETWTAPPIYSHLTYEQCVELERYYDKYYVPSVGFKRPNLPINRFLWQIYFTSLSHKPKENIFCNVIDCWKSAKRTYERSGLQPVRNTPGSKETYKRMLDYQNAMKASETEVAAELLGASLSVSGSNPVRADSGGDCGSGDGGAGGPPAYECILETTGRLASSLSYSGGEP